MNPDMAVRSVMVGSKSVTTPHGARIAKLPSAYLYDQETVPAKNSEGCWELYFRYNPANFHKDQFAEPRVKFPLRRGDQVEVSEVRPLFQVHTQHPPPLSSLSHCHPRWLAAVVARTVLIPTLPIPGLRTLPIGAKNRRSRGLHRHPSRLSQLLAHMSRAKMYHADLVYLLISCPSPRLGKFSSITAWHH